jgi:hypothetical protein
VLDLNCTTPQPFGGQATYGNNIITYNITTYSCTTPNNESVTIAGYPEPAPDFPHSNYNRSCTINSFNLTTLVLTQFVHQSQWALEQLNSPEVLTHDILIQLYNPATDDSYRIQEGWWEEQGANETQGIWRECSDPNSQLLLSCSFLYNNITNEIAVKVEWFCDDRDPEHA